MQQMVAHSTRRQFILQSPNAYDKTVAYTTAMLKELKDPCGDVKALVLAPTNDRVHKIAEIIREKAPVYRTVEICDGTYLYDERKAFSPTPDIAVATPRQLLNHIVHKNINIKQVTVLVYDDYDKSLELGFHDVICNVVSCTPLRSTIVLTSTAPVDNLPKVITLENADVYLHTPKITPSTDTRSYPGKTCYSGPRASSNSARFSHVGCLRAFSAKLLSPLRHPRSMLMARENIPHVDSS